MKNELYTPDQLVLLMHKLSTNGIRFSKIPAGIYTTKGISGKAVVEWIKSEMELYENDRMEEVRNKALDLRKDDGDVGVYAGRNEEKKMGKRCSHIERQAF